MQNEVNTAYEVDLYDIDLVGSSVELIAELQARGKPVFVAEYADEFVQDSAARRTVCEEAGERGFQLLILPLELDDSFWMDCIL